MSTHTNFHDPRIIPCQDSVGHKSHPRMCKYFAIYMRSERCSFLHFSILEHDHTASAWVQTIQQEVFDLMEGMRIEIDRLGNLNY